MEWASFGPERAPTLVLQVKVMGGLPAIGGPTDDARRPRNFNWRGSSFALPRGAVVRHLASLTAYFAVAAAFPSFWTSVRLHIRAFKSRKSRREEDLHHKSTNGPLHARISTSELHHPLTNQTNISGYIMFRSAALFAFLGKSTFSTD